MKQNLSWAQFSYIPSKSINTNISSFVNYTHKLLNSRGQVDAI